MINRHNDYNKVIKEIKDMENKGEIFVIRPEKKLDIKLSEKNSDKMQMIYDHGIEVGNNILKDLKKYIGEL